MSKRGKTKRKRKQRQQRRKAAGAPQTTTLRWQSAADRAEQFIRRGQWAEARNVLEEAERTAPGRREILRRLLDVYHNLRDYGPYGRVCERLLEQEPDNPGLHLMLAHGYMAAACPVSALLAFERYLRRFPDDPMGEGARKTFARLEACVNEVLEGLPFPEADQYELASMHERVLRGLGESDVQYTVELAQRLVSRCPNFLPGLNNLSAAYRFAGRMDEAVATEKRVLELDPQNLHALANLAQTLLLSGRLEDAERYLARLRALESNDPLIWCKKAETASYFGDDQTVLEALEGAERCGWLREEGPGAVLLHHLAAVALARQGDDRRAQQHWRKALKKNPKFWLAEENLADAKAAPGQRHGPWPFSVDYWLRKDLTERALNRFGKAGPNDDDRALERAAWQYAEENPELVKLVPALLDRGDKTGRQIGWWFAIALQTPELLETLRTFCLSQRGPDELRFETAKFLCRKGAIPSGPTRMWLGGQWQEIELFGFEVTEEPVGRLHSPQVDDWLYEAFDAMSCGQGKLGEKLLVKCIEAEGEQPDLLNNLAKAYELQGKTDKADALVRRVHERWPDYFFGRIGMAGQAVQRGDYDEAERHLEPLRRRRRLHTTEFAALCKAHIALDAGRHELEAAKRWYSMWKDMDPDNPQLAEVEALFTFGGLLGQVGGWK